MMVIAHLLPVGLTQTIVPLDRRMHLMGDDDLNYSDEHLTMIEISSLQTRFPRLC
jgi:hypothetical protein